MEKALRRFGKSIPTIWKKHSDDLEKAFRRYGLRSIPGRSFRNDFGQEAYDDYRSIGQNFLPCKAKKVPRLILYRGRRHLPQGWRSLSPPCPPSWPPQAPTPRRRAPRAVRRCSGGSSRSPPRAARVSRVPKETGRGGEGGTKHPNHKKNVNVNVTVNIFAKKNKIVFFTSVYNKFPNAPTS